MTAQLWLSTNLVRLQKAVFCVPTARSLARAERSLRLLWKSVLLTLSRVLGGTIEPELSFGFATSVHVVSDGIGVSLSAAA
jgi:hypothetical protein